MQYQHVAIHCVLRDPRARLRRRRGGAARGVRHRMVRAPVRAGVRGVAPGGARVRRVVPDALRARCVRHGVVDDDEIEVDVVEVRGRHLAHEVLAGGRSLAL
eukprot:gene9540-biopygen10196